MFYIQFFKQMRIFFIINKVTYIMYILGFNTKWQFSHLIVGILGICDVMKRSDYTIKY